MKFCRRSPAQMKGQLAAGPQTRSCRRVSVSEWLTAAGPLSLQTCPGAGCGVPVPPQEHPPALPSADCPAVDRAVPETVETQPELVAHHYTEAGLMSRPFPTGSGPVSERCNCQPIPKQYGSITWPYNPWSVRNRWMRHSAARCCCRWVKRNGRRANSLRPMKRCYARPTLPGR